MHSASGSNTWGRQALQSAEAGTGASSSCTRRTASRKEKSHDGDGDSDDSCLPLIPVFPSGNAEPFRARPPRESPSKTALSPNSTNILSRLASRQNPDPLTTLRACVRELIARPGVYGSVPTLLLDIYNTVVQHHCTLGDVRCGTAPSAMSASGGESEILRELRAVRSREERLKHANESLDQQVDALQLKLREMELVVKRAEDMQAAAEQQEIENKSKLQQMSLQYSTLHAEYTKLRALVGKLQQQQQHNSHGDEQKVAERTSELRSELSRLYEHVRSQEEMCKSFEREATNAKADHEDLESKHSQLLKDYESLQETVINKDEAIVGLSRSVAERDTKIAELEALIGELKLQCGQTMVQQLLVAKNPLWSKFRERRLSERKEWCSPVPYPGGKKQVKGLGEGADIPPHLQFTGKLKPKQISRNDLMVLIYDAFSEMILQRTTLRQATDSGTVVGWEEYAVLSSSQLSPPFATQFKWWLQRRCNDSEKEAADLAYGVQACMDRWKGDPDVHLMDALLRGSVPPMIVPILFSSLQTLYDAFLREDSAMNGADAPRYVLPVPTMHKVISAFFEEPSHTATPHEVEKLQFVLSMDQNTPFILYRAIFEVDEDGNRGYFLEAAWKIIVSCALTYYDDVLRALRTSVEDAASPQQQEAVSSAPHVRLADFKVSLTSMDPGRAATADSLVKCMISSVHNKNLQFRGVGQPSVDKVPSEDAESFIKSVLLLRLAKPAVAGKDSNSKIPSAVFQDTVSSGSDAEPSPNSTSRLARHSNSTLRRTTQDVFKMIHMSMALRTNIQLPLSFQSFRFVKGARSRSAFSAEPSLKDSS